MVDILKSKGSTIERAAAFPVPPARPKPKNARVVVLDEKALLRIGVLAPGDQHQQQAAEYRAIKRQLIVNMKRPKTGKEPSDRLILVTSAIAGEGKTFTSINLALTLARERDYSVLLVDGDVVKRSLSRLFEIEQLPGLLNAVRDDYARLDDFVVETSVKGLSVLPAGSASQEATEELASSKMENLVARLLDDPTRIVIVDSPPLLLTAEALSIAQYMGQVIVVVDAQSTSQRAVHDAIDLLGERTGIQLVLNRSTRSVLQNYYHGYGYGYEQSAADEGSDRG